MKIAVLSDIHGNLDALQAVLIDIKSLDINKIFICGDLAVAGPEPVETVDYIIELTKKYDVTIIQGNTDEMVIKSTGSPEDKYTPPNKIMAEAVKYAQKVLRADQKEFLMELPETYSEKIGNLSVIFVHGSPRRNNEDILPDMPLEKVKEMIESTKENIIFCGHTHLPVIYHIGKQTVVNVGSVGRPFTEKPKACYTVLDYPDLSGSKFVIDQRFIAYDQESAANKLSKLPFKGSDKLAKMLIKAISRYPE
ncbi:MAG: metallophosphoesterase family protein [Candidatus Gastranaerophilales bacterium]|nr:metallophosphoesterase family protein [Candidatus Gastranaerophilales bacterium]